MHSHFSRRSARSLALAAALLLASGCHAKRIGPNILLITLDTTRRDHLGMYGYAIPTSPRLDELAADSVVYTNAYATSSWTLPTHASLFTGKFPSAHGANYDANGNLILTQGIEGNFGGYRARSIAEKERTLAGALAEQGYATGGVAGGPWLKKVFHLDQGFDFYDDENVTALNGRDAKDVTRVAIDFVDAHASEPFFLFLNYYDAHSPWWEDPPMDEQGHPKGPPKPLHDPRPVLPPGADSTPMDQVKYARICYDAEIRYMDGEIGRLLDHLKETGLYEDLWIFVMADHGELLGDPVLGEGGLWGHGDSLTEPEIHIPFLVKGSGAARRKGQDATLVQQVDVLPEILRALALPRPADIQGTGLTGRQMVVAQLHKLPMMNLGRSEGPNPRDWRHLGDWNVLVDDAHHKLGLSSRDTQDENYDFLVDLAGDPGERANLHGKNAELEARLKNALTRYILELPRPGAVGAAHPVGQSASEALKSLGYIGTDGEAPAGSIWIEDSGAATPGNASSPSPPDGK